MNVNIGALSLGALFFSMVCFGILAKKLSITAMRKMTIAVAATSLVLVFTDFLFIHHISPLTAPSAIIKFSLHLKQMPSPILGIIVPLVLIGIFVATMKLIDRQEKKQEGA